MSNPIKDLFSRFRNRLGGQNTQPSLEEIFGSVPGFGGVIEIDGSDDINDILAGIFGAGRNGSGLRETLASLVGISPEDIDETDPCPGCNKVHPGSGLSAAARRLRETGSAKKTETAGRQDGSEIWRRDLAAAQAIGMFMEEPDMAAATANAFGELLYEQTGGDKEKLVKLLGKLKTETIALDEAGATAARTAKRISKSLATAAEDYERRLAQQEDEIRDLRRQMDLQRDTLREATSDVSRSEVNWFSRDELIESLQGVAARQYPKAYRMYYVRQAGQSTIEQELATAKQRGTDASAYENLLTRFETQVGEGSLTAAQVKEAIANIRTAGFCTPQQLFTPTPVTVEAEPLAEFIEEQFDEPAPANRVEEVAETVGA